MKTFYQYIYETKEAWIRPDDDAIKHEYNIEYKNHHAHTGFYKNEKEFTHAVKKAKILHVTPEIDRGISGRSHTSNFNELHNLIKGYASYPKFRNEKTLKHLSNKIKAGESVHHPMLLHHGKGRYSIMGGNTRADLAMQHHGHYKALVLEKS